MFGGFCGFCVLVCLFLLFVFGFCVSFVARSLPLKQNIGLYHPSGGKMCFLFFWGEDQDLSCVH